MQKCKNAMVSFETQHYGAICFLTQARWLNASRLTYGAAAHDGPDDGANRGAMPSNARMCAAMTTRWATPVKVRTDEDLINSPTRRKRLRAQATHCRWWPSCTNHRTTTMSSSLWRQCPGSRRMPSTPSAPSGSLGCLLAAAACLSCRMACW